MSNWNFELCNTKTLLLGPQVDSDIEVTGCKSNVTVTFDTQKEDEEVGEQKIVTQKTNGGKNEDWDLSS